MAVRRVVSAGRCPDGDGVGGDGPGRPAHGALDGGADILEGADVAHPPTRFGTGICKVVGSLLHLARFCLKTKAISPELILIVQKIQVAL